MMEASDADRIQYLGLSSHTESCLDALRIILQFCPEIEHVHLLSFSGQHGFLIDTATGIWAIKPGFASGYSGAAPKGLAVAMSALLQHRIMISEYYVSRGLMTRLDKGSLRPQDLEQLLDNPPTCSRWHVYLESVNSKRNLWDQPTGIPFGLIDKRLMEFALRFWENPDDMVFAGYRRLEDIVRTRSGIEEHGAKLFKQAFGQTDPVLTWAECTKKEQHCRAELFAAAYSSFRNPRAHREVDTHPKLALQEFLLLNHLYSLEELATVAVESPTLE